MTKPKKQITEFDGSALTGHESSGYREDMVITFTRYKAGQEQTAVLSLDLYDLAQLVGRIHQHIAAQDAKLQKLRKALKGEA